MFRSLVIRLTQLHSARQGRKFISGVAGRLKHEKKWKKWSPLPLGVGFAYIAYQQYGHVREREESKLGVVREAKPFKPWMVSLYTSLPLRVESRLWGWFSKINLPVFLRKPLIGAFARVFSCDLSEAVEEDLAKYNNLNEFFRRPIKPELRPIANTFLVAPADGVVHACGRLVNDRIEHVKGMTYTLAAFVGQDLAKELSNSGRSSRGKELFYCVIYLSPSDCHRFFAPVDWKLNFRRHITGYLLGVNKKVVCRVPNVLSINERVLLTGEWEHGFFSMTPVGATHVGSIILDCEKSLNTNCPSKCIGDMDDKRYEKTIQQRRGDYVGEFNMGSSLVLIFEAPRNFQFGKKPGDKLKHGESMA